ncbi:metallophosphoesterase family protein [Desulfovulcanus sp.]
MSDFSFIHAADLHLDAPFKGIYGQDENIARELMQATFRAYDGLIDLCLKEDVDFLLIAGDVYNSQVRSLKGQLKFLEGVKRLAKQDIQVFVVHGNHDPLGTKSLAITWPENVYFFPGDRVVWEVAKNRQGRDVALVGGVSHSSTKEQRNLAKQFDPPTCDLFKIGLLHTNVGNLAPKAPYAPCQLTDLISKDIGYWALGHIHDRRIMHKDPYVVYSGNIQGLHINEPGERGCYLVRVFETGWLELEFKSLESLLWQIIEIDLQDISSLNHVQEAIINECLKARTHASASLSNPNNKPVICRVKLSGRTALSKELNRDDLLEEMLNYVRDNLSAEEPFVWVKDILVDCRLATAAEAAAADADFNSLKQGEGLLAEIIRISEEFEQEPDRLDFVLNDVFSHHKIRKIVPDLSFSEAQNLIHQARLLCWDGLRDG